MVDVAASPGGFCSKTLPVNPNYQTVQTCGIGRDLTACSDNTRKLEHFIGDDTQQPGWVLYQGIVPTFPVMV
jgi:hypothetical protein